DQQVGQKRFEPERTPVFIAVNDIEDQGAGNDRSPSESKVKFHFPAVAAFKACRDFAFIGQAAALTKRRCDKAHAPPAVDADVAFSRRRRFGTTELTNLRIEKTQAGIKPAFPAAFQCRGVHCVGAGAAAAWRENRCQRNNRTNPSTTSASQPSINRFVPQNQVLEPSVW